MPAYRLELFLADGQIVQTLAFFSLDDEQALAWGDEVGLAPSLPSRRGMGGQQAGRQAGLAVPTGASLPIEHRGGGKVAALVARSNVEWRRPNPTTFFIKQKHRDYIQN